MKVIQINTTFKNGGSTGRIAYDLKKVMEQNGIESYAAYGIATSAENEVNTIKLQSWLELKISQVQSRLFARHGYYNVAATKRLLAYIDKINPDVIHLHNIHGYYVHCGMLFDYIKRHNLPVVWTLHDCWAFTGWCAYFDYANCERWKSQCYNCPCRRDYPKAWITCRSKSNYEIKRNTFSDVENLTLVSPSQWLANLTRDSYLKDYPVIVINNGVDTNNFKPESGNTKERLGISGKKMLLAVAGGLAKRKGRDYLLKIPTILKEDEVLVILGITEKQKEQLPKDKCIGIPYTNKLSELVSLYSDADVFINTTLEDNFPTTNIEALACGTPVVTFNTGGSVEAVLDNEELSIDDKFKRSSVGGVVPKGDLESMFLLVREILSDNQKKYKEKCVNKVVGFYNKQEQYKKYVKLYQDVIVK